MRKVILFNIISIILLFYLVEVGFEMYLGPYAINTTKGSRLIKAVSEFGGSDMTREEYLFRNWIASQKKYPEMVGLTWVKNADVNLKKTGFIPLRGKANAPTIMCNETGEMRTFKSDEYGFNNDAGAHSEKNIDLILIGDSFTEGFCVARSDNIAGNLIKRGYSTLNLGSGGSDPVWQQAILREYAAGHEDAYLVWIFYEGNDLLSIKESKKLLPYYIDDPAFTQSLKEKQGLINSMVEEFTQKKVSECEDALSPLGRLKSILKLNHVRKKLCAVGIEINRNGVRWVSHKDHRYVYDQTFEKIMREVKKEYGKLIFVYLPSASEYFKNTNFDYKKDEVLAYMNSIGASIIDMSNELDTWKREDLFVKDVYGHYSPKVYNEISIKIDTLLKQSNQSGR